VSFIARQFSEVAFHAFFTKENCAMLCLSQWVMLAKSLFTFAALGTFAMTSLAAPKIPANAPAPYGALPSPRQIVWHETETYAFLHFTVNTFTDKEWGYGDESPQIFNPAQFDAKKIVADIKAAGFKGVNLTAKHHDGFCLWPSKYTEHSVKNSPWKGGKGDVVREIADACREAGLKFGIYLSPWDRNHPQYGKPEYLIYYRNQLRELLTNYGPLFMVWLDGANGGDGYYGGARETRKIDAATYYDWPNTLKIVRELQPNACVFSDAGPDVRWVGNEKGIAPETSWHTMKLEGIYPGKPGINQMLLNGVRGGETWLPAEADVSIRPGWFYHAYEDNKVKTPAQLLEIYYASVGHGAGLHLNFPPDRRGLIHETDAANAKEFRRLVDATFKTNLATSAKVTASSTRRSDFDAWRIVDKKRDSFWAAEDGATAPEIIFELKAPARFDVIELGEFIPLGQRLDSFEVDVWRENAWSEIARGTSVGYKKLVRLNAPVEATKVRLRLHAPVAPTLSHFGLYLQPDYQRDGATRSDGISRAKWKIVNVTNETPGSGLAINLLDGKPNTLWHTHGPDGEHAPPHSVTIDMGETLKLSGFTYLPRQDGTRRGMVSHYEFHVSTDGQNWTRAAQGEFSNVANNPILQSVRFAAPQTARFIRFVATRAVEANHIAVAEISVSTG
jgi:alpha-L-fucosidase